MNQLRNKIILSQIHHGLKESTSKEPWSYTCPKCGRHEGFSFQPLTEMLPGVPMPKCLGDQCMKEHMSANQEQIRVIFVQQLLHLRQHLVDVTDMITVDHPIWNEEDDDEEEDSGSDTDSFFSKIDYETECETQGYQTDLDL